MNRAVQPGLMILAAVALVIAAVLLPAVILRPSDQVERLKQPPAIQPPPGRKTAVAEKPAPRAPAIQAEQEGDLSRAQRFRMVQQETLKRLGPSALSAALARAFAFPHSRDDAVFGIDVSHHNEKNCQCNIDWGNVARQKVAFVVAKATEGVWFRDPDFRSHWDELGKIPDIHRGAYHFLSADDDPEEQAHYFLARLGALRATDLPPALDLEWDTVVRSTRKWSKREGDYWSQLTPNEILDRALKWLDVVEKKTGRTPIVYTSRAWWDGRIKSDALLARLKRYPIWLSAMEEKDLQVERPGTRGGWADKWNWTLWQFTNRGDLTRAGIRNPGNPNIEGFDVNLFRGSLAEFRLAMGITPPIVVAEKDAKVPGGAASGTSAATAGTPAKEPQKDAAKEAAGETQTPTASATASGAGKPGESSTAAAPDTTSGTAAAKEPAKEAPKESASAGQTAAVPAAGGGTVKPGDSGATATPPEASGSGAKQEPPKETPKEPQAETQVAGVPGGDSGTKPGGSGAAAMPSGAGGAAAAATEPVKEPQKEAASEPQVAAVPSGSGAGKPGDSTATTAPETGGAAAAKEPPKEEPKASETQVAALPGPDTSGDQSREPTVVPGTPDAGAPAATGQPEKAPEKQTQIASVPDTSAAGSTGGAGATASAPSAKTGEAAVLQAPADAASPTSTIEIVLLNGRVLRVDINIDPAVLMRFVALLEK